MSSVLKIGKGSEICCKFEWEIPNFSFYDTEDSIFESPVFHASNARWFIKIWPRSLASETFNGYGYVSLFLYKVCGKDSLVYNFSFGIKTVNHTIENKMEATYKDPNTGFTKFLSRMILMFRERELVPFDTLTIVCFVEVKNAAREYKNFNACKN